MAEGMSRSIRLSLPGSSWSGRSTPGRPSRTMESWYVPGSRCAVATGEMPRSRIAPVVRTPSFSTTGAIRTFAPGGVVARDTTASARKARSRSPAGSYKRRRWRSSSRSGLRSSLAARAARKSANAARTSSRFPPRRRASSKLVAASANAAVVLARRPSARCHFSSPQALRPASNSRNDSARAEARLSPSARGGEFVASRARFLKRGAGVGEPVRDVRIELALSQEARSGDQRDESEDPSGDERAAPPRGARDRLLRGAEELAGRFGKEARIDRPRLREPARSPERLAVSSRAHPFRGRRFHSLPDELVTRFLLDPAGQGPPGREQRLVRQLHRLSVVDDEQPSADERLERSLGCRVTSGELVVGMSRAGELRGREPEQKPPRCLALPGKESRKDGVGVAGEGAGDAAQGIDSSGRDDPALAVPRFPDLREHELQERQAAERRRGGSRQLPDEAVRLEPEALGGGRTGDGLAEIVLGEAAEQVEGAGDELAEGRERGERSEEVVARRREDPDAVVSRGELGERSRHGGRFLATERDELLELIYEDDDAALVRELPLDLAREPARILAQQLLCSFGVVRLERVRQGGEGTPAGNQPGDAPRARRPESAVAHRGDDAGEADRGFTDPGIAGDQHEALDPHPLDEREAVSRPAEEERAVLGLEGLQAAIRIALGQRDAPPGPRPIERLEKLVGGGESLPR